MNNFVLLADHRLRWWCQLFKFKLQKMQFCDDCFLQSSAPNQMIIRSSDKSSPLLYHDRSRFCDFKTKMWKLDFKTLNLSEGPSWNSASVMAQKSTPSCVNSYIRDENLHTALYVLPLPKTIRVDNVDNNVFHSNLWIYSYDNSLQNCV